MKASDLIEELEKLVEKHGNQEIVTLGSVDRVTIFLKPNFTYMDSQMISDCYKFERIYYNMDHDLDIDEFFVL